MHDDLNLCNLQKSSPFSGPSCARKSRPPEAQSYQQQILAQAKSLGQLRRHYVARKCFEDNIDEKEALAEICKYKACNPCCSEMQILQMLLQNKASPDTIIYQTYVVEAQKGKCSGADETFRKLKQKGSTPSVLPKHLIRPCCDDEYPVGLGLREYERTRLAEKAPPVTSGRRPRTQPIASSTPYSAGPSKPPWLPRRSERSKPPCLPCETKQPKPPCLPCRAERPKPTCSPCAAPLSDCPGPRSSTPHPMIRLTPCEEKKSSCDWRNPHMASTPISKEGAPEQISDYFSSPGLTPVPKRKTRIPVPIRQDLAKTQKKRQARDTTGSRIPCPISTQLPRSTRFSRVEDEAPCSPDARRRISFGGTQVSYFEDTLPSLVSVPAQDESQDFVTPSVSLSEHPKHFKEYKSMIDQEKKEIREMHNVVTKLMDRPEKVEFRDMYSLVPSISYIDDTMTDTAPEVAAAMLHSDELGLNMKSPPTEVYNTLFKGGDMDKTTIKVTPEENAKTVLPVSSEGFAATLLTYDQQGFFENVNTEIDYDLPEMPAPKKKEGEEAAEGEEKDKEEEKQQDEKKEEGTGQPPDQEGSEKKTPEGPDDKQAPRSRLSKMDSNVSDEFDKSLFDVQLQIDLQSNSDFVQIRGSQPPPWFPGYYVAMGDTMKINVVRKPWDILEKAWRKFEPNTLNPDKGTYVLGI